MESRRPVNSDVMRLSLITDVLMEKLPFKHRRISHDEETLPFADSRRVVMFSGMDGLRSGIKKQSDAAGLGVRHGGCLQRSQPSSKSAKSVWGSGLGVCRERRIIIFSNAPNNL